MAKEYGGYMPLELHNGQEYFDRYPEADIARFNCGRNAIAAAFLSVKPGKVYLPYYVCSVVRETLERYCIPYECYLLDDQLLPKIDRIENDDWLLYVNYFGTMSDDRTQKIVNKYNRVVIDNTQAFYAKPIFTDNCFNVYLPRKFFGLIDGAYLVWNGKRKVGMHYPTDISWNRGAFLLKSIELGTNAAYQDNLASMECYDDGIRLMSKLTERMLKSIDYEETAQIRQKNYLTLVQEFDGINELSLPMEGYAPYVYPLFIRNDELRHQIVSEKIYVPQWWKYLLSEVPDDSQEAKLSKWLLPLPVDHRYNEEDMRTISHIIKKYL